MEGSGGVCAAGMRLQLYGLCAASEKESIILEVIKNVSQVSKKCSVLCVCVVFI